ncbi:hypothetical protein BHE90_005402 [Fusarium euwallaceae]|uniref:Uncharacterized protein n=4 Tax=Fusarium solani species complex TaxID=232080 RepID=A0A3M2RYW1_9HYPO|nr:hypothetical protein CDV36_010084 [Fusarium kuroshium]RSL66166.1 hypothetical protein CEP53_003426 [Fusarium sp. AF-6]RSL80371.1 hypothetical protein CEP51_006638 [Fusarium floridanum]RSM13969.1 hypothetical protein CEP52_001684 [Fusarium oligoseptatum]RTE80074.1 hypothetical protein BHE90_005402 [Fusarium euwallaceae]
MAGGPRLSPMIQREMADRAANTSARRVAEEYEAARLRLSDQTFNMLSYPDPLVPRKQSTTYPPGVTPEMEKKWLQVIEQSKK